VDDSGGCPNDHGSYNSAGILLAGDSRETQLVVAERYL
jgi:hypothetical protein